MKHNLIPKAAVLLGAAALLPNALAASAVGALNSTVHFPGGALTVTTEETETGSRTTFTLENDLPDAQSTAAAEQAVKNALSEADYAAYCGINDRLTEIMDAVESNSPEVLPDFAQYKAEIESLQSERSALLRNAGVDTADYEGPVYFCVTDDGYMIWSSLPEDADGAPAAAVSCIDSTEA